MIMDEIIQFVNYSLNMNLISKRKFAKIFVPHHNNRCEQPLLLTN